MSLDAAARRKLIEQYLAGIREVEAALEGITPRELDHHPAPGKWSPREIVHHLADSEMTGVVRLRRVLAEDHPAIPAYDQDVYARKLHYERPIESSLEAFRAARRVNADLMERLGEEEWAREGTHSEVGRYTITGWLEIYAKHAHNHAAQIRRARAAAAGGA
jgi:hypothetical protein